MKFLKAALAMTALLSASQAFSESHFDRKHNGVRIYDLILKQDVPEKALRRVFEFLDINSDKTVVLKDRDRNGRKVVTDIQKMTIRDDYATIIDYSKPSNVPRLYLINISSGNVEKYLVAHGRNSGAVVAGSFSNLDESKQSSLGLYVGGRIYRGKHGKSLQLHGLEPSNSNAMYRDIVIHSARYVSYDYIKSHGRLGRSWGCPAVSPRIIQRVLTTMQNGSVIYGYHSALMTTTLKNPSLQVLVKPGVDTGDNRDLPGEEEDFAKKGKAGATPEKAQPAQTAHPAQPTQPVQPAAPEVTVPLKDKKDIPNAADKLSTLTSTKKSAPAVDNKKGLSSTQKDLTKKSTSEKPKAAPAKKVAPVKAPQKAAPKAQVVPQKVTTPAKAKEEPKAQKPVSKEVQKTDLKESQKESAKEVAKVKAAAEKKDDKKDDKPQAKEKISKASLATKK